MTQIPADWYPDPAPAQPGVPPGQRYWDGTQWTEHVSASYGQPHRPSYSFKTTPDGDRLAGWWARAGASLLDFFILLPVIALAALPVFWWQWDPMADYFRQSVDAYQSGLAPPPEPGLLRTWSGPGLALQASMLLVAAAYTLGFWRWKQATPGKLIVGLRVRRREVPGVMPWSTMLIRFAVVNVLVLAGDGGVLYWVAAGFVLLNYLWPLWDEKNQALHDKAARTNVVVHRR